MQALKQVYKGKKLIVGRDRLDKVRGVIQNWKASKSFWICIRNGETVVLIQVSSPGYSHSANVETRVTEIISRINSKYGNLNHTPFCITR